MTVDPYQAQSTAAPDNNNSKPIISAIRGKPKPPSTAAHQNILSVATNEAVQAYPKSATTIDPAHLKPMTAPKSFPLPTTGAHQAKTTAAPGQVNSKPTTDTNHTKQMTTHPLTNPKPTTAEDEGKPKLMTNVNQSKSTFPAHISSKPTTPAQAKPKPIASAQESPLPITTVNPTRTDQVHPKPPLVNNKMSVNEDNRLAKEMR